MNLIKATIAIAAITVCCMGNEYPAKAEYLRRTGESVYGGNSYNHGRSSSINPATAGVAPATAAALPTDGCSELEQQA